MDPNTPQSNEQPEPSTPTVSPEPPVTPPQPSGPVSTSPDAAPAAAPSPKDKKKLIIIAAAVGGALILAIVGLIIFLVLTTVSKQDYAAAAQQFNAVSSANSSLTTEVSSLSSSSSSSDSRFEASVKAVDESIAKLKTENDKLGALKAVRVGEGQKLYGEFDTKLKAYLGYGAEVLASVTSLRPALVKCDAVSDAKDTTARVTALKACSSELNNVKDIPNDTFKTFVDTLKTEYATYATTYESISALSNPYGANYEQYKTLRDKMYDTQDNIRTASTTFSKSMRENDEKLSVKDSAKALSEYLNEQQKK